MLKEQETCYPNVQLVELGRAICRRKLNVFNFFLLTKITVHLAVVDGPLYSDVQGG